MRHPFELAIIKTQVNRDRDPNVGIVGTKRVRSVHALSQYLKLLFSTSYVNYRGAVIDRWIQVAITWNGSNHKLSFQPLRPTVINYDEDDWLIKSIQSIKWRDDEAGKVFAKKVIETCQVTSKIEKTGLLTDGMALDIIRRSLEYTNAEQAEFIFAKVNKWFATHKGQESF